ncbi:thioredoxin domain-containing protein [Actinomarinicola tropica]|uniref:Thioredoxin domain-containing protein n=2 Tax=Actinomarinicola tropica TaxID=2789776 RepID=A0A5Q2RP10_9ACTN|nr:thioredoxin domain-containing protein [Actinomarinicola tropica]
MVVAAVGVALIVANTEGNPGGTAPDAAGPQVVRADSQRLSTGDTDATFVEFLDFECEACRAAHPMVEQLRSAYGDDMTFVVRNFPLHNNSEAAAQAAEAAAAQGRFEEMYDLLFETQPQWGESDQSQEDVFFGLAEDLGLDMEQFRGVYDDPATLEKIRRDKADGQALGVTGTPTFFLDGEKVEVESFEELQAMIEQAIGG